MNYIEVANQELLWKMAHKIPQFLQLPDVKQQEMFYELIKTMYEEIGTHIIPREELLYQNQTTLKRIMENCQPKTDSQNVAHRQKEYDFKKPDVPTGLFKEKEDGAMENMDELIEEYKSKRNLDIQPSVHERLEKMEKEISVLRSELKELKIFH